MSCKYVATDRPRVVIGRHEYGCPDEESCTGCLPCTMDHCRVCQRVHADGTCPECVGEARDNLHRIAALCDALPAEVEHRGVHGEAMMLLGPAADPEARGHLEASILAGRVPADYLDVADGDRHPLYVLGTWLMVWQDALEHDDEHQVTITHAVGYLDQQLTYMSGFTHAPFEDFAHDLRDCRTHLESVLSDSSMGDRANIGCFDCGRSLERKLTDQGFEDVWTCRGCRRRYTYAEYNFALRANLEAAQA